MSQSGVVSWSTTAANNATADSNVNWAEGQAPSTVNDSARATMASVAKYNLDISGTITTGGTSTAYTLTSNQSFSALSVLHNNVIAFIPNVTSGATPTLNVDSLGAKGIRFSPGIDLPAGTLISGTPYFVTYNNSDGYFYLHNSFGNNPYFLPIGGLMPYVGSSAPNSNFVLPYGQAISRATYATLFALTSTTFGTGDGSTTFNLPDLRGRAVFGLDNMGGSAASRITSGGSGITGTTIGATGGAETKTLVTNNLPPYTPAGSVSVTAHVGVNSSTSYSVTGGGTALTGPGGSTSVAIDSQTFTGSAQGGTSTPVVTISPTIVLPYIMRVI